MRKIKIYFGKTNEYNAEIIENVTDSKVIVLETTRTLEEVKEDYYIDSFYEITSDIEIYEQDVLNEFELTEIAEYEEETKMEEMIKELKEELLNKEMTLLDMDNTCEVVLDSPTTIYDCDYLNSALGDTLDMGEETDSGCMGYMTSDDNGEVKEVVVDFDVLSKDYIKKMNEDSDYQFQILVKVTGIWIA